MDKDNLKQFPSESDGNKILTTPQGISQSSSLQMTDDSLLDSTLGHTSEEESEKESGAESDWRSMDSVEEPLTKSIKNDLDLELEKFECPMCRFLNVTSPNFLTTHNMVMCYLAEETDMKYSCFAFKQQVDQNEPGALLDIASHSENEKFWYLPKVVAFKLEPKVSETKET